MREYRYHATEATIELLRRLRQPWAGYLATAEALTVLLASGGAVRVAVERAEVEPHFDAYRLTAAESETLPTLLSELGDGVDDFAAGKNDVVIFHGETWLEPVAVGRPGAPQADATVQFTGRAGQRSPTADAVCMTTDALVVASVRGTGLLVRIGLRPFALDVTDDRATIASFLLERGYSG